MDNGLLMAVKKQYPDITKAPPDIRMEVEKQERMQAKPKHNLKEELLDTSEMFGAARDHLVAVIEARDQHRLRWLKHLQSSAEIWKDQLADYNRQKLQYQDLIDSAKAKFEEARTANQTVNQKAGTLEVPPTAIDSSDKEAQDGQNEAELRSKVTMTLQACMQAVEADEPIDVDELSEKEDQPTKRHRGGSPTA